MLILIISHLLAFHFILSTSQHIASENTLPYTSDALILQDRKQIRRNVSPLKVFDHLQPEAEGHH